VAGRAGELQHGGDSRQTMTVAVEVTVAGPNLRFRVEGYAETAGRRGDTTGVQIPIFDPTTQTPFPGNWATM
jgi:hypothetical protein